jgi:4-amino-4-deoxy-L-arabinose transferase-like glycosyltransferase
MVDCMTGNSDTPAPVDRLSETETDVPTAGATPSSGTAATTVAQPTAAGATMAVVGRAAEERSGAAWPPPPAGDASIRRIESVERALDAGANAGSTTIPRWVQMLVAFIAPSSLITALAFYFGEVRTDAYFSYFGIDRSMINFTTADYLLRSTDVLFIPLGALLIGTLALLWGHFLLQSHHFRDGRLHGDVAIVCIVLGGVLLVMGAVDAWQGLPFHTPFLFGRLSPGVGVALLAYGLRLRGGTRSLGWGSLVNRTLVGFVIVLSLFAATSDYAAALGRGRAQQFAAGLLDQPEAVVYSTVPLHLEGFGVEPTSLQEDGNPGYRYRYRGLRSLLRSGGHYFLVPALWSQSNDAMAIILPDTPSILLQFGKGANT